MIETIYTIYLSEHHPNDAAKLRTFLKENEFNWSEEEIEREVRECDICKNPMKEGYCVGNGEAYYCTKDCLNREISDEEFEKYYDNGNGDSYWTEWESIYLDE